MNNDERIESLKRDHRADPYNVQILYRLSNLLRRSGAIELIADLRRRRSEMSYENLQAQAALIVHELELELRKIHPRIRRSRRHADELLEWARRVVEEEGIPIDIDELFEPYWERQGALQESWWEQVNNLKKQVEELISYLMPEKGGEERVWQICDSSTYSTTGTSADYYARMCADTDSATADTLDFPTEVVLNRRPEAPYYLTNSYSLKSFLKEEIDKEILLQKVNYFEKYFRKSYYDFINTLPHKGRYGSISYKEYLNQFKDTLI